MIEAGGEEWCGEKPLGWGMSKKKPTIMGDERDTNGIKQDSHHPHLD
jgi:hypothetical protein